MSMTDIMEACFERLDAFAYAPQPPVLWPGTQAEPPATGAWLQASFFPNEPIDRSWSDEAAPEVRGFFQVLVCYRVRPGTGQVAPSLLADALIEHFPKGLELGSVRVLKRPWQSPNVVEDASRSFIPVTIPYLGYLCADVTAEFYVTYLGETVTHLGEPVTYTI
ncbi:MAG: phage tail terminator-like protein [Lysobacterales bacterium]